MFKPLSDFELRLIGYRLVTAEITYRSPDYRDILNEFIWQKLDIAPKFPVLNSFLDFWEKEIEGPIHSVRVAHSQLLSNSDFRAHKYEFRLH